MFIQINKVLNVLA